MKRFLLLFCAVMLVCSIMIVPAFAASDNIVEIHDYGSTGSHPELTFGDYVLRITIDGVLAVDEIICIDRAFTMIDYSVLGHVVRFTNDMDDGNGYWEVVMNCTCYEVNPETSYVYIAPYDGIPVEPEPGSPIGVVLDVFSGIGSWITGQLSAATSLFWNSAAGELTFIGVLVVVGLAFAVIFLLIGFIQRFLQFRG